MNLLTYLIIFILALSSVESKFKFCEIDPVTKKCKKIIKQSPMRPSTHIYEKKPPFQTDYYNSKIKRTQPEYYEILRRDLQNKKAYYQDQPRYGQNQPEYGQSQSVYDQRQPAYVQRQPSSYDQNRPRPGYGLNYPEYNQNQYAPPAYDQNPSKYDHISSEYDQNHPGYDQVQPQYAYVQPEYNQVPLKYGQSKPKIIYTQSMLKPTIHILKPKVTSDLLFIDDDDYFEDNRHDDDQSFDLFETHAVPDSGEFAYTLAFSNRKEKIPEKTNENDVSSHLE